MPDSLQDINVIVHINPAILFGILAVVVMLIAFVSLMMVYHWREYALNRRALGIAALLYFSVSIALIGVSVVSIIGYASSLP